MKADPNEAMEMLAMEIERWSKNTGYGVGCVVFSNDGKLVAHISHPGLSYLSMAQLLCNGSAACISTHVGNEEAKKKENKPPPLILA